MYMQKTQDTWVLLLVLAVLVISIAVFMLLIPHLPAPEPDFTPLIY